MALVRSVSDNDIGPEGAKYFANALVVNQSLTSLKCVPVHHLMTDVIKCQQPLTVLAFPSRAA